MAMRKLDKIWSDQVVETEGKRQIPLKENQSYVICGRSGSGKTTFIYNFLKNANKMIATNKKNVILYCYDTWQNMYNKMQAEIPDIHFHKGMLPLKQIVNGFGDPEDRHLIVVLDDLMSEVVNSQDVSNFFTISCHHSSCSMIFVTHNLFQQGRYSKTIAVNASYVMIFETPAGVEQIRVYGRQRFSSDILLLSYIKAVLDKPFGYIFIDMTVNVPRDLRIRTDILPNQETIYYC